MGNCAYRPITLRDTGDPLVPDGFDYTRSVFDWSAHPDTLAPLCAWRDVGKAEPDLCCVYVIRPEEGNFCKIGISDRPGWRLAGLQTGCWSELSIHSVLWVWSNGARGVETAAHAAAKKLGIERRREWVRLPPDLATILVLEAAAYLNVEAGGSESINATRNSHIRSRARALKVARTAQAQARAANQGY